jgi:3-dehydroquinate synthase
MNKSVHVELGAATYPVVISDTLDLLGVRLAERRPAGAVVLVSESTVGPLWGDAAASALARGGFTVTRLTIPAGEHNKTVKTWTNLVSLLLGAGVDRQTPVVALGGGVLGDVVGFAAATALRGLPFVQVPTTLLAMVDSSVGGKTGVNHPLGKNLIGAFHQPALVFAALETLSTLPPAERIAGLGEVLKAAVLRGDSMFDEVANRADRLQLGDRDAVGWAVAQCVAQKASVVAADEKESGVRAILNAGHTLGHGLETALGYGTLRHGEAVSIGLVAEARWAERLGVCDELGLADRIAACAGALGLPALAPTVSKDVVLRAMRVDKKVVQGKITVPLPVGVGNYTLHKVPLERLSELIEYL